MRRRPVASRRLALEPLESRAMLSVTVEGLDATWFTPDVVVCPCPVIINGPDGTVEPRIIIDPLVIDQPIAIDPLIINDPIVDGPWNTEDPSEAVHSLFEEYNAFLADHPEWLSEHGADGIQLQVMTESAYVSGLFLSNPGTARAFDAWIEQTYLMVDGENPLVDTGDATDIDDACPEVDEQGFTIGAADVHVRALAFSTMTSTAADRPDRQWMGQASAFSPSQFAEAAPARPKRGVAAPVVRG